MFWCKTTCDLPSANKIHPFLHIYTHSSKEKKKKKDWNSWRYKGNKVSDYCSWTHLLILSFQRVGRKGLATWIAFKERVEKHPFRENKNCLGELMEAKVMKVTYFSSCCAGEETYYMWLWEYNSPFLSIETWQNT